MAGHLYVRKTSPLYFQTEEWVKYKDDVFCLFYDFLKKGNPRAISCISSNNIAISTKIVLGHQSPLSTNTDLLPFLLRQNLCVFLTKLS